jgi:hypothetical protein
MAVSKLPQVIAAFAFTQKSAPRIRRKSLFCNDLHFFLLFLSAALAM